MKNIANNVAKKILVALAASIKKDVITTTEAWTLFSKPEEKNIPAKMFRKPSKEDLQHLIALRDNVKNVLRGKARKRCAYCRRPMGSHNISWHIEHIKPKAKFPELIFDMSNLVFACIDCNYTKNNQIDGAKKYIFDIIHPGTPGFSYAGELEYVQLTTEHLHILKYDPISDEGKSTYRRLKLDRIEALEVVSGLNSTVREISHKIDDAIVEFCKNGEHEDIGQFLTGLKLQLATHK